MKKTLILLSLLFSVIQINAQQSEDIKGLWKLESIEIKEYVDNLVSNQLLLPIVNEEIQGNLSFDIGNSVIKELALENSEFSFLDIDGFLVEGIYILNDNNLEMIGTLSRKNKNDEDFHEQYVILFDGDRISLTKILYVTLMGNESLKREVNLKLKPLSIQEDFKLRWESLRK